jgi:hypothetical protein
MEGSVGNASPWLFELVTIRIPCRLISLTANMLFFEFEVEAN